MVALTLEMKETNAEQIPMDGVVGSPDDDGREQGETLALLNTEDKQQQGADDNSNQADESNQANDSIQADDSSQPNGSGQADQGTVSDAGEHSVLEELFMKPEQEVLKIINKFIHDGHEPNDMPRDRRGYSVLHLSAELNFLTVVEKLLEYDHDPLAYDLEGNIALSVAIRQQSDEMAALIVSKTKPKLVRKLFGDNTVVDDKSTSAKGKRGMTKQQLLMKERTSSTLKACCCVKAERVGGRSDGNGATSGSVQVANSNDSDQNISSANRLTDAEMRKMFFKESEITKMFDMNKDLIDQDLKETINAVLDSLAEEKSSGRSTVFVKLLEEDGQGLEPGDKGFNTKYHTVFHNIAINLKMEASNHPVMKMLVDYKWQTWCRRKFVLNSISYLLSLFCLTYSIVVGTAVKEVTVYDTRLQHSRAVLEILTYLFALNTFFIEVRQLYSHVLDYCKQFFNWLEIWSSFLVLIALPLRYTQEQAHWFVLAVAYLLWVMRIFKYAYVFSQTGAYAESLKRILTGDFIQFSMLFLVINMTFGGTFLLVQRGEGSLQTYEDTSSYWGILLVGLRIMVEAGTVVEYVGPGTYKTTGTFVYIVFMLVTIVVLLNILIAQLSDTYQQVQSASFKAARANRAWNITRSERNERQFCRKQLQRIKYYKPYFTNVNMKELRKKYTTKLEGISEDLVAIKKKQVKDALETLTVKNRVSNIRRNMEDAHRHIVTVSGDSLRLSSKGVERVANLETKVNILDDKLESVKQQLEELKTLLAAKD